MQKVRGYIFFENKNLSDIKNAFINFRFNEAIFSFFTSIIIDEKIINCPGVFLTGEINSNYDRDHIIKLFRKLLDLNDELKNYNLSLSSKDLIQPILTDRPLGCYSCMSLNYLSSLDNIELIAGKIKRLFEPRDLWIRTTEQEGVKTVNIDMIGENYLDIKSVELDSSIKELGLTIKQLGRINLIK